MDRIGGEVRHELARFGPVHTTARILDVWAEVVGPAVARNAWPARVARDGTLHVATSSSAWAFELAQLTPRILERLREALGDDAPATLRFAPGRVPEPPAPAPEERPRPPAKPGAAERAKAAALASEIEDEELRRTVSRAVAAALARRRYDRPL